MGKSKERQDGRKAMAMGSEARKCKIRKKGRQGPPPGKPRV